ncbi:class I SAM-dependent methyltransferase [uncultured Winogradskyella sp.]|uniref:class I SAM-dependent methyltransferase n=1 Tax=uncultured Winogradskyella sp. TaxID=395353 RepID=UPI00260A64FA|nr:class I SAM-dependent methyltransferase [uncultured Winogradskyella sp.]
MKDFVNIKLSLKNLDTYYIRKSILVGLSKYLGDFNGTMLDIGCGKMPYRDYILENSKISKYVGLDIETALIYDKKVKPDCTWDGVTMPFDDESFDCAFGTEVLEHCAEPEVVLSEVYRILKPGGIFFFTVPFLWNLHEVPNDEYRYTPFSLERHLNKCGFLNVSIIATGGWHASMAQMMGLWVRRSPLSSNKRKILSYFLKPMIKYLIKLDNPETVKFIEGQMITGLYGHVRK